MKLAKSKTSKESKSSTASKLNDNLLESFFSSQKQKSQTFFGTDFIQPKLKIGRPGDKYEREADCVADTVMRMPDPQVQRQPKEKEEWLQMKSDGISSSGENIVSSEISGRLNAKTGAGRSLSKNVQSEMSQKIGADFSNVSIHTDSEAEKLNQQMGARAFTHGRDIYFNEGEYKPESSEGKRLLAHELTHVVQQGEINQRIQLNGNEQDSNGRNGTPSNDQSVIELEPQYIWTPDEAQYNEDYNAANRHLSLYIDSAQSTVSAMITAYLEAKQKVEEIFSLQDPDSIWESIAVFVLTTVIAAIPGAGPVASRLSSIASTRGGFYAKGLEEALKTLATKLVVYSINIDDTAPHISASPGPLGQIERLNDIVQIEIRKRYLIQQKWAEGWNAAKSSSNSPPWNYNLNSIVRSAFQPVISLNVSDFRMEFEKMLAKEAIQETVQASTGTLVFGGTTVYDFYEPTLSHHSLRKLVRRYGWSVSQIARWARYWPGGAWPWNWYRIEEGEEL